jgi:hypothetical protein
VNDKEIDKILEQAGEARHEVDPALLDRVARTIETSMRPVRPLPPTWMTAGVLIMICFGVALAAAARAGMHGFENLSALQRALIFPALAVFVLVAAVVCVREMIPGSRRIVEPGALLGIGCVALLGVYAFLFRQYRTENFVHAGVVCLTVGLLLAIPSGLASWIVLRRGFAVNSIAAGLAAGTLAGLAGVTMLELHCTNFQAPHVMLWHTSVLPLSAAAGALLAWAARHRYAASKQIR